MLQTVRFKELFAWLCLPTARERCNYLETHLELLGDEFEQLLALLSIQYYDDPCEQRHLYEHRSLLAEARARGGTALAIREAYINVYGGLLFALPEWLLDLEVYLQTFASLRPTERMYTLAKLRLYDAIEHVHPEQAFAPEILAELHYHLGSMFAHKEHRMSAYSVAQIVTHYEAALEIYTYERYPMQYVKVHLAFGNAYRCARRGVCQP